MQHVGRPGGHPRNVRVCVIIDGCKVTSDITKDIRHHLRKEHARKCFTAPICVKRDVNISGLGWPSSKFDLIDWAALSSALAPKPDMYGVWLAKQTIGVCATRRNMTKIGGGLDDRCPNCLCGPERNDHLLRCSDPGRTELFDDDVRNLQTWMIGRANTNDEIADKIYTYLMLRGEVTMGELGNMSPDMATVAQAFDTIGWVDVMHGRLPVALRRLQQQHYQLAGEGSADAWMTQLTRRIIDIAHGQWLFRNFSLHNKATGYLLLQRKEEVLTSITQLADSAPSDIPVESHFLLAIDPSNLAADSLL